MRNQGQAQQAESWNSETRDIRPNFVSDDYENEESLNYPLLGDPIVPKKRSTLLTVCPYILGNEFCERLAYYGLATNMVVYFQTHAGMSASEAAANVGLWSGSCYLTPLLGAWLADSFFGRYNVILGFTVIYMVGMLALTLDPFLTETAGNAAPPAGNSLLYFALYVIALGTGGIKPNVSAFGAEQFDETDAQDRLEKSSFFNWFYFAINVGSLLASLVVVYVQENISWTVGFAIPTVALVLACISFWSGRSLYKRTLPKKSPISRLCLVLWAAVVNSPSPSQRTHQRDWLDRASLDGRFSPAQIHEVRLVLRLLPIFFTSIMYWAIYQQMSSVFVQQGVQMDRTVYEGFTIPSASLSTFDTISIVVLVPFFDRVVYPSLAWCFGCKLTMLQRMGWGMAVSASAMLAAAGVEHVRLGLTNEGKILPDSNPPAADLTVFLQIPQYVLIGISEVLASIAQLEFFYDQSPAVMRSCAMALQLLSSAIGMYLSSAIVYAVQTFTAPNHWIQDNLNDGRLDLYFLLLSVLMMINLIFHVIVSMAYVYKDAKKPLTPWPSFATMEAAQAPAPLQASAVGDRSASVPIQAQAPRHTDMARSVTAMPQTPLMPAQFR